MKKLRFRTVRLSPDHEYGHDQGWRSDLLEGLGWAGGRISGLCESDQRESKPSYDVAPTTGDLNMRPMEYWQICRMKRLVAALILGAALIPCTAAYAEVKTIVLVHGAFADGSGWKSVADILQSHGYSVRVVQEPGTSFTADVAATRRVLDKAGPCV